MLGGFAGLCGSNLARGAAGADGRLETDKSKYARLSRAGGEKSRVVGLFSLEFTTIVWLRLEGDKGFGFGPKAIFDQDVGPFLKL